jgi:hypothetical protein
VPELVAEASLAVGADAPLPRGSQVRQLAQGSASSAKCNCCSLRTMGVLRKFWVPRAPPHEAAAAQSASRRAEAMAPGFIASKAARSSVPSPVFDRVHVVYVSPRTKVRIRGILLYIHVSTNECIQIRMYAAYYSCSISRYLEYLLVSTAACTGEGCQ